MRVIPSEQDSLLVRSPHVALLWDYDKNPDDMVPSNISYRSNVLVSWRCANGHEFDARVTKLTGHLNYECRVCASSTSKADLALFDRLVAVDSFVDVSHDVDFIDESYRSAIDIVVSALDMKVAIEYDGARWHKREDRIKRDLRKTRKLIDAGYKVIRIREQPLMHLELDDESLVQVSYKQSKKESNIDSLAFEIVKIINSIGGKDGDQDEA